MFTGLIEAVGTVHTIDTTADGSRMVIACAPDFLADAKLGDSIAIDGVCTTAVELSKTTFTIEASPETLSKTTFNQLAQESKINLEKPLLPTSRLGGHFVSGHVDCTATVLAKYQEGNSWIFRFLLDNKALAPLLIDKGSVAINGISLTVNTVDGPAFTVAIIPHTLDNTSIGQLEVDSSVNIECDILGKYVQKMLQNSIGNAIASHSATNVHPTGKKGQLSDGPWFNHDEAIHGPIDPFISPLVNGPSSS